MIQALIKRNFGFRRTCLKVATDTFLRVGVVTYIRSNAVAICTHAREYELTSGNVLVNPAFEFWKLAYKAPYLCQI